MNENILILFAMFTHLLVEISIKIVINPISSEHHLCIVICLKVVMAHESSLSPLNIMLTWGSGVAVKLGKSVSHLIFLICIPAHDINREMQSYSKGKILEVFKIPNVNNIVSWKNIKKK